MTTPHTMMLANREHVEKRVEQFKHRSREVRAKLKDVLKQLWNPERQLAMIQDLGAFAELRNRFPIRTITTIVRYEKSSEIFPLIQRYVQKGSHIMTDSGNAFSALKHEYFHTKVNHSVEYMAADGTNNNQAESYFSRVRRAEFGVFNGL